MKINPIRIAKNLLLACCCMLLTSCAHSGKYSYEKMGYCNYPLQSGNFESIRERNEEAAKLRDRNYALWSNQLGSIYLAQGDYEKALSSFLEAHYLMNNIPAFKELEASAISLIGSEDRKAYKGDPYEKALNSLYVGLLLYNKGDLENSMAAFKNGILADSDSEGESYKSDIAILYLLASRIAKKSGNNSLSADYYNSVKDLQSNSNYSFLGFSDELMQKIIDLKNNTLLVVEFGQGPSKSRKGQYGELAVIRENRSGFNVLNVEIDGKTKANNQIYSDTDVSFQASTRGGRKMDGILKGQAQFKRNAANTSVAMAELSNECVNQANAARISNPYADTTGYALVAGVAAIFSGVSAIASTVTNPKADIRCWGLLPEHIAVFPLSLSPGKHKINIGIDKRYSLREFEVDIQKDKDNIIFKRILSYQVSKKQIAPLSEDTAEKVEVSGDKRESFFSKMKRKFREMTNKEKSVEPQEKTAIQKEASDISDSELTNQGMPDKTIAEMIIAKQGEVLDAGDRNLLIQRIRGKNIAGIETILGESISSEKFDGRISKADYIYKGKIITIFFDFRKGIVNGWSL